jgi:hypothetical protein
VAATRTPGRARELLESTDHNSEQIAERCGYRSVESFRVAFRSVVGVPPSVYRERFGRGVKALSRWPCGLHRQNAARTDRKSSRLAQKIGVHDPAMPVGRLAHPLDLIRHILELAADQDFIRRAQVGPQ